MHSPDPMFPNGFSCPQQIPSASLQFTAAASQSLTRGILDSMGIHQDVNVIVNVIVNVWVEMLTFEPKRQRFRPIVNVPGSPSRLVAMLAFEGHAIVNTQLPVPSANDVNVCPHHDRPSHDGTNVLRIRNVSYHDSRNASYRSW